MYNLNFNNNFAIKDHSIKANNNFAIKAYCIQARMEITLQWEASLVLIRFGIKKLERTARGKSFSIAFGIQNAFLLTFPHNHCHLKKSLAFEFERFDAQKYTRF
jgi:hypothetical protein